MKTSETVAAIAPAVLAVQEQLQPLVRDRRNTYYESSYASLDQVLDVARTALNQRGVIVVQDVVAPVADSSLPAGNLQQVTIETCLLHAETGEWMRFSLPVPIVAKGKKDEPANRPTNTIDLAAALTTGRRLGLVAALALSQADEDDDAIKKRTPAGPQAPRKPHEFKIPFGDYQGRRLAELPSAIINNAGRWAKEHGKYDLFQAAALAVLADRKAGTAEEPTEAPQKNPPKATRGGEA